MVKVNESAQRPRAVRHRRISSARIFVLALSTCGSWVCAEPVDKICDARPPCIAAAYANLSSATLTRLAGGAGLAARERQLYLGLLEFTVGNTAVEAGVDYQYTRYEYTNVDSRDRDLHRLQFPVRFNSRFEAWALQGYLAPGISTSSNVFKDFVNRGSSDDVFVTGRLNGRWNSGDRSWFLGIAHDRRFGKPAAYPVAGVDFSSSEFLSLRIAYPDPGMRIMLSDRQIMVASLFPAGHQWSVASDDSTERFAYRVKTWRAQLTWNVRLRQSIGVDLSLGYDFRREHDFRDNLDSQLNSDVDNQWVLGVGFRLGTATLPYTHGGHL